MRVEEYNKGTSKSATAGMKRMKRNMAGGEKSLRFRNVSMKSFHSVLLESGVKVKDLMKGIKLSVQEAGFFFLTSAVLK